MLLLLACTTTKEPSPTTWYRDADGDGYGDPATTVTAEVAPDGYVADGSDCDDADGAVGPGAWYPDDDGDGWGDADGLQAGCTNPGGLLDVGEDCDDGDPEINPDALDRCENAIDEDCSGADLECRVEGTHDLETADIVWRGAGIGDGAGEVLDCGGDFDGDGVPEALISQREKKRNWYDLEDGDGTVWLVTPGAPGEYVLGDEIPHVSGALVGATVAEVGKHVGSPGDLDGDGRDELIVSEFLFTYPIPDSPSQATPRYYYSLDAGGEGGLGGPMQVEPLGDGRYLLFSSRWTVDEPYTVGAGFLMEGLPTGDTGTAAAIGSLSPDPSHHGGAFGSSTCVGDMDGDGIRDVAIGSMGGNWDFQPRVVVYGLTYVVYGPLAGDLRMSSATGTLIDADAVVRAGANEVASIGYDVSCGGDVGGDGLDDLVVGAPNSGQFTETGAWDYRGAAFYFEGPLHGEATTNDARGAVGGLSPNQFVGQAVESDADLDTDGFADIVVSAYEAEDYSGRVAIFYGGFEGMVAITDGDAVFEGSAGDSAVEIAACPDLDGDGADDLLIGAMGEDTNGGYAGAAYMVAGGGS